MWECRSEGCGTVGVRGVECEGEGWGVGGAGVGGEVSGVCMGVWM